jgi:hypothetical protein
MNQAATAIFEAGIGKAALQTSVHRHLNRSCTRLRVANFDFGPGSDPAYQWDLVICPGHLPRTFTMDIPPWTSPHGDPPDIPIDQSWEWSWGSAS